MKTSIKNIFLSALILLSFGTNALAASEVNVNLKEGETTYKGTLYLPEKPAGKLPLVVVVHEWWGKTEHPESQAERLADELGYAALAVDLFGDGKTADNPKDAQGLATPFYQNPTQAVKRLQAFVTLALDEAKEGKATLDPLKVAAIGYCFGGSQVLNLARAGGLEQQGKLLGVVSFHGGLASGLKAKKPMKTKVLVLHGAADKMVSDKEVAAFKSEMKKANAKLEFHAYPGALHAFTNPKATETGKKFGIPVAYDEKADADSWLKMKGFLKGLFKI